MMKFDLYYYLLLVAIMVCSRYDLASLGDRIEFYI